MSSPSASPGASNANLSSHTTGSWVNSRGLKLFSQSWTPQGEPWRALLFLHHGIGDHSGRYAAVLGHLSRRGVACFTYDAFSHGLSEGQPRVSCTRFDEFVDDLVEFVGTTVGSLPPTRAALPRFLLGVSFGGLVCCITALRQPAPWMTGGLVLVAAALDVDRTFLLKLQEPLAGVLSRLVPNARLAPAVREEDMTPDPLELAKWKTDPLLTHGAIRARVAAETLSAFGEAKRLALTCHLPVLAVHGERDRCTSAAAVARFVAAAPSQDKAFVSLPGGLHLVFHGPTRMAAIGGITDWVLLRAAGGSMCRSKL